MSKSKKNVRETLQKIPSVDDILNKYPIDVPKSFLKNHINNVLNQIRSDIRNNRKNKNINNYIDKRIKKMIDKITSNSLRQIINGTGIILHTGLGRAPISKEIILKGFYLTVQFLVLMLLTIQILLRN